MTSEPRSILIPAENVARSRRDFPGYDVERIQVFHAVRALAQRMNDATTGWLAPFGLSAAKFNYLVVLYARRDAPMTPNELMSYVHTVSGTVTNMIDALVRDGLVTRKVNPADGRSRVIALTPKGERLAVKAATEHHRRITAALGGISKREARTLLASLARTARALERVPH